MSAEFTPANTQDFLGYSPEQRHQLLANAYDSIRNNAQTVKPSFSVLIGGSCIYGYNGHPDARLDDIDGVLIADRELDADYLNEKLRGIYETDSLSDPEGIDQNLRDFGNRKIDLVRVAGLYQGSIPFSLHCLPLDLFRSGFSRTRTDKPHVIVAPNKPKYLAEQYPISLTSKVVPSPINYDLSDSGDLAIKQYFSRSLPDGDIIVDFLADELITSEVAWEKPGSGVGSTLLAHKRTFIRSALFYQPEATNDEIVDILSRSARFSASYRQNLNCLIETERDILSKVRFI
jgi:hypothetical protein